MIHAKWRLLLRALIISNRAASEIHVEAFFLSLKRENRGLTEAQLIQLVYWGYC